MASIFTVKPFSMSIGLLNEDSQPNQLDKAGTLPDDTTRQWGTGAPRPNGYSGEVIKSTNPLLVSFKLPQQVCDLTNPIVEINLNLRYSNPSSVPALRATLLPFVAKRANSPHTSNRTIGYSQAAIANVVARNQLGYVEQAILTSSNATVSFASVFPRIQNRDIRLPKWMEYIKTLVSSNSDPILTFAIYPNTDANSLYIIEQNSADLSTLFANLSITTAVSGSNFTNDVSDINFNSSTLAPVIAGKETEIGKIKYSAGVGVHGSTNTKPDGQPGVLDKTFPLGQYLADSAHVSPQFIVDPGSKVNLVGNGRFEKEEITTVPPSPLGETTKTLSSSANLSCWAGYSRSTTSRVQLSKVDVASYESGSAKSPFGFDPVFYCSPNSSEHRSLMRVETFDATYSSSAWQRSLTSNKYWQYSTVFQTVGAQLEEEEEYLLEAWVKPYSSTTSAGNVSTGAKIRMAYVTGYQPEEDPADGEYLTHHTGGSSASVDATFPASGSVALQEANATWQRLWVKIKLPRKNSIQRTLAFYNDTDDPDVEARELLVSDPPFFQTGGTKVSKKVSHGEIRFDVIPIFNNSSASYRANTKFLVSNVTLMKLSKRQYDSDSAPFDNAKSLPIERPRSGTSIPSVAGESISYYIPMRGTSISGYNTSMYIASKNAWVGIGNDKQHFSLNKFVGIDRIDPSATQELGGPFSSPRSEYLYKFTPSYNGKDQVGKYHRGAHLGLHAGDKVSILNPNEGTVDFWYSPVDMNYADPNTPQAVVALHGRPVSRKTTGAEQFYRPWEFVNRYGDTSDTNNNNYDTYRHYLWLGGPLHIMSFVYAPIGWTTDSNIGKAWNGGLFSGCCVSFFRQGRMIFCLISETGSIAAPWNNQFPLLGSNSQRKKARFSLLKYQIPENLCKGKNVISEEDVIPSWFNIKLAWGARQELYVNGTLVDFNGMSGLFQRPAKNVTEFKEIHNNYPNAIWIGAQGILTGDSVWTNPINQCDSMLISDIMISEVSKSQTKVASSKGTPISWMELENKKIMSTGTIGGVVNGGR